MVASCFLDLPNSIRHKHYSCTTSIPWSSKFYQITITLILKDIVASTKTTASFKLNNFKSSKVDLQISYKFELKLEKQSNVCILNTIHASSFMISVILQIDTTLTSTYIFFPSTKAIASLELLDFRSGKVYTLASLNLVYSFLHLIWCLRFWVVIFLPQLDVHYFHHHATLTSTVALNHSPTINISATIGTPIFAMGAKVGYENETSSSKFTNFTVGISVNLPDSTASIVL